MDEFNEFCSDGAVIIDKNVSEREMKSALLKGRNSLIASNPRVGRTAEVLVSPTSTSRHECPYAASRFNAAPGSEMHRMPLLWVVREPGNLDFGAGIVLGPGFVDRRLPAFILYRPTNFNDLA